MAISVESYRLWLQVGLGQTWGCAMSLVYGRLEHSLTLAVSLLVGSLLRAPPLRLTARRCQAPPAGFLHLCQIVHDPHLQKFLKLFLE